jgi:hypothetical protein
MNKQTSLFFELVAQKIGQLIADMAEPGEVPGRALLEAPPRILWVMRTFDSRETINFIKTFSRTSRRVMGQSFDRSPQKGASDFGIMTVLLTFHASGIVPREKQAHMIRKAACIAA